MKTEGPLDRPILSPPRKRSIRCVSAILGLALAVLLPGLLHLRAATQSGRRDGGGDGLLLLPEKRKGAPDPAMASLFDKLDPRADGWESELFSDAAQAQLEAIGHLLGGAGSIPASALRTMVAPGFTCGPLRPASLQEVFRDGSVTVARADPARPAAGVERAAGSYAGAEGLSRALEDLSEPLENASGVQVEFIMFQVDMAGESGATGVRFHMSGRTERGGVEQTATWRIRWRRPVSGAPPLLERIDVQQFEEVVGISPGGRLFSDITEAVLGGNRSFREHLLPGVDHWLGRIESWIESDSFGHHGIALGDVNGDGLEDLYACQMGGLPNLLFVQNRDGTATDISAAAGVDWLERTRSALLADLDNDGDQDLVVATSVALLFMANDGKGRFRVEKALLVPEDPAAGGKARPAAATGGYPIGGDEGGAHYQRAGDIGGLRTFDLVMLAAADYDNDGNVDIYACAYHAPGEEVDRFPIPIPYHDANNGGANLLLRNDGKWGFTDVTKEVGLDANNRRFSFAASWEDFDNDGDQDLYVANDFGRNNLFRNDGGRFVDIAAHAGVEDIAAGMSASWGDFDNDGWMDLYVGNMFSAAGSRIASQREFQEQAAGETRSLYMRHSRGNSLFQNSRDGTFRDMSLESGTTMGRWAWSSNFIDLNNDGWEDLLVANGYFTKEDPHDLSSFFWRQVVGRSPAEAVEPASVPQYSAAWKALGRLIHNGKSFSGRERNVCFLNTRGARFADISATSGLDFIDDTRAVASTDWDMDGDLDVWLANRTGPRLRLARNDAQAGGRSLAVKLEGRASNRDGIGARLELYLAGSSSASVSSGGSGSSDLPGSSTRPGSAPRKLIKTLRAGEGYLAQSSKWVHFGLGEAARMEKLVVRWPGGSPEEFTGLEAGRRYLLVQGSGKIQPANLPARSVSLAAKELGSPAPSYQAGIFLSAPVPAPSLAYLDLDGRRVSMDEGARGPILLTLWADGCGPCVTQLEDLTKREAELRSSGTGVVALNAEELLQDRKADLPAARDLLARLKFPFDSGVAPAELVDKLELIQDKVVWIPRPFPVPSSFLIDSDGLLGAIYRGPVSIETLLADIAALRTSGERRLSLAIPFAGLRQTRAWPSFFDYMDTIAQVYVTGGYPEEAVAYYRKVLRIKPGRVQAHFSLATALAGLGQMDEAISQYREALVIDPGHVAALSNLGFALAGQGKIHEAMELYRKALEREPENVSTLNNLGAALAGQGRLDEAIARYRKAVSIEPGNAPARNNLAVALARQGKDDEAVIEYRRLLSADPSNAFARINLGLALARQGHMPEAVEHLSEAVRLKPDHPESRYHLGVTLLRQMNLREAEAHLSEATRLRPDYAQAHYYLALALAKQGKIQEGAARFAEAMRLPAESAAAAARLAWVLATHQDPVLRDGPQAVKLAERLCQVSRNCETSALDTLGAAYAEAGRFPEAVEAARKAIELAQSRGEADLAAQIRGRLRLYEDQHPFHDNPGLKK